MAFPPMRLLEFHSAFEVRILRYQMQLIAQPVTFSVFTLRAFQACLGEPSPCLIRFARSHLLRPKSEGSCRALWVAPLTITARCAFPANINLTKPSGFRGATWSRTTFSVPVSGVPKHHGLIDYFAPSQLPLPSLRLARSHPFRRFP